MLLVLTNNLERTLTGATSPVGYQAHAWGPLDRFNTLSDMSAARDQEALSPSFLTLESLKLLRQVAWIRDFGNAA